MKRREFLSGAVAGAAADLAAGADLAASVEAPPEAEGRRQVGEEDRRKAKGKKQQAKVKTARTLAHFTIFEFRVSSFDIQVPDA